MPNIRKDSTSRIQYLLDNLLTIWYYIFGIIFLYLIISSFRWLDNASDDSTYESLYSCQQDDFSSDSEGTSDKRQHSRRHASDGNCVINTYLECPTRPNPPPPREASLTQSLGRRVKMLRRTWSITKGSLGRIRRRTSVEDCFDEKEQSEQHHHHHVDIGKYFNFRKHFRKSIASPSTFYLDENEKNNACGAIDNNNGIAKEAIYTNSQYMGSGSDDSSRSLATTVGESPTFFVLFNFIFQLVQT